MVRKPDFFLVGAPKCGTTSMYEYLRPHPQIFMPRIKEPHYFGSDLDIRAEGDRRTFEEYLALYEGSESFARAGDCSVHYLHSQRAAREIHDFNPQARILIMVREPVGAMISWHGQLVSMGIEDIFDFEEAVRAQDDRRAGRRLPETKRMRLGLQYTDMFSYPDQIERYVDAFGRAQLHIIVLDDLIADNTGVYKDVLRFLDVDDTFQPDFGVHNEKKWLRAPPVNKLMTKNQGLRSFAKLATPRTLRRWMVGVLSHIFPSPPRPEIRIEYINELRASCQPDVDRLGRLLERDLSHWYAPKPVPQHKS